MPGPFPTHIDGQFSREDAAKVRELLSQIVFNEYISKDKLLYGLVLTGNLPFNNVQQRMRRRGIYNDFIRAKIQSIENEKEKNKELLDKAEAISIKKERKLRQFKAKPAPNFIKKRPKRLSPLRPKTSDSKVEINDVN